MPSSVKRTKTQELTVLGNPLGGVKQILLVFYLLLSISLLIFLHQQQTLNKALASNV